MGRPLEAFVLRTDVVGAGEGEGVRWEGGTYEDEDGRASKLKLTFFFFPGVTAGEDGRERIPFGMSTPSSSGGFKARLRVP